MQVTAEMTRMPLTCAPATHGVAIFPNKQVSGRSRTEVKKLMRAKLRMLPIRAAGRLTKTPYNAQQLVAVARAVISSPKLILADEPTGNLHSSQGKEIMELFKKLNEGGTTIIQVTHSEVNAAYGSRVIQLKDGWMVD